MKNMNERNKSSHHSDKVGHKPKPPKLKLTVQYAAQTARLLPPRLSFREWIKAALMKDAEIVLRIVDEEEGRHLNRDFRNKDYATNVLTFAYSDVLPEIQSQVPVNEQPMAGDIVLCVPVVENEARQQGKNLTAHYAHLTIHGVLHLQGYDHEWDADAVTMERLEVDILGKLGYPDPYEGYERITGGS
jgi:probable rRNA maturation factor